MSNLRDAPRNSTIQQLLSTKGSQRSSRRMAHPNLYIHQALECKARFASQWLVELVMLAYVLFGALGLPSSTQSLCVSDSIAHCPDRGRGFVGKFSHSAPPRQTISCGMSIAQRATNRQAGLGRSSVHIGRHARQTSSWFVPRHHTTLHLSTWRSYSCSRNFNNSTNYRWIRSRGGLAYFITLPTCRYQQVDYGNCA